jgi:acetyl-CoA acetyltransferase
MVEAFLVDAVRTPVGRRGGGLAGTHPADLGAHVIAALLARVGLDPRVVDDVIFGCVDTIGPQVSDCLARAMTAGSLAAICAAVARAAASSRSRGTTSSTLPNSCSWYAVTVAQV